LETPGEKQISDLLKSLGKRYPPSPEGPIRTNSIPLSIGRKS